MLFYVITPQTITRAEQLVAAIERRITEEALAPGTFVGTRESLRRESGLAKSTINEAVRLLAERGLVTVRPGRGGGLFVAEKNAVVRLRHTLLSVPAGSSALADVIEVRDALEPLVAAVAARHCTDADAEVLRRHVERLRQTSRAGDDQAFLSANWSLHEAIAKIGPNEYLRAVYLGTLHPISDTPTSARLEDRVDKVRYLQERAEHHAELVEAIISGDPQRVAAAVSVHGQPSAGGTGTPGPAKS
jgi:GntR family transcriptional regulator, transcriptional repressor for pyruvate dehydrogenase complex